MSRELAFGIFFILGGLVGIGSHIWAVRANVDPCIQARQDWMWIKDAYPRSIDERLKAAEVFRRYEPCMDKEK